jgi:hypothetical protein
VVVGSVPAGLAGVLGELSELDGQIKPISQAVREATIQLEEAAFDLSRGRQALLSVTQPALGALLALGALPSARVLALGLVAATSGFLAVFSLNDLLDRKVDADALGAGKAQAEGFDIDTAFTRHPLAAGRITKVDQILPYFVINELPAGLPGLLIAAIYSGTMSATSSGINALTTATLVDFRQRLSRKPPTSEAQQLRLARYLTIAYGALVIVLAFGVSMLGSLIEASNKVIGLVGGPLLGLFLLGMLSKRTNAPGAAMGWVAGVGTLVPVCFFSNVSFLWYTLFGLAATMVVGWGASWLFPPPQPKSLDGLVWESRYQEAPPSARAS